MNLNNLAANSEKSLIVKWSTGEHIFVTVKNTKAVFTHAQQSGRFFRPETLLTSSSVSSTCLPPLFHRDITFGVCRTSETPTPPPGTIRRNCRVQLLPESGQRCWSYFHKKLQKLTTSQIVGNSSKKTLMYDMSAPGGPKPTFAPGPPQEFGLALAVAWQTGVGCEPGSVGHCSRSRIITQLSSH